MPQVPDVRLDGLYGDRILDHYRNPRNRAPLPDPDLFWSEFNPFCGDRVELLLKLDTDGRVADVNADSEGCSIIQASASMLSCQLTGRTLEETEKLDAEFRSLMEGEQPTTEALQSLGDLESLRVVLAYPVRIKCALLPWVALEQALKAYGKRTA